MATVSPTAGLLTTQINHEQEKAYDDMALKISGELETNTETMLKSYRYTLADARPTLSALMIFKHRGLREPGLPQCC